VIDQLLVAWRATRDPRAEAAIVRLGRGLARTKGPLVDPAHPYGGAKLEKLWHETALGAPVAELDRLLDVPWTLTWEAMLRRVRILAQFPPDPRIARKLVAVARWHMTQPSLALHEAVAAVLLRCLTPAIAPGLDALLAGRGKHVLAVYAPVIEALRALAPHVEPAELAPLWAEVYASPGDLEKRAVLAEALMVEDDPRGELIQLQLSDEKKARGRAVRLLACHLDEWIGPLPMVERQSVRFARGFPVALCSSAGGEELARAIELPQWRTLERLALRGGSPSLAPLLHRLPLLRVLELDHDGLDAIAADGPFPGIRALCVDGTPWRPPPGLFPDLRLLAGSWAATNAVPDLAAIIQRKASWTQIGGLVPTRDIGAPEVRIALGPAPLLEPTGWCIRLWWRRTDVELAWHGKSRPEHVGEVLGALAAAGYREVHIQIADRLVINDVASLQVVRAARTLAITYGTEPFDLAEGAAR
jgi:hypothetical protein